MANEEHVTLLKQGVDAWNAWRGKNRDVQPDLSGANLSGANLSEAELIGTNLTGANLSKADLSKAELASADLSGANLIGTNFTGANLVYAYLSKADLSEVDLSGAKLSGANFTGANLHKAILSGANLREPDLSGANLSGANLPGADLSGAKLSGANLSGADLSGAKLSEANLHEANLHEANLSGADLTKASLSGARFEKANLSEVNLCRADLSRAQLTKADLSRADLTYATLVEADLTDANLTGCRIYGVSAWGLKLEETKQKSLIITTGDEPEITVDNIEVAQFIYLMLHNEKIRDILDTIGRKGVLLLGRFTEGRLEILEKLREKLRNLGFVPMVFNFDKPETKDFTETVRLLAGMSHFVIVDITNPRSAPLELQATVPDYMVPFAPILQDGEPPFAMFVDLQRKYHWVLNVIEYPSVDRLIEVLEDKIVKRAKEKFNDLLAQRTEQLRKEKA
jgi:uncharacterized protein YjbI with pentapeptide repeats